MRSVVTGDLHFSKYSNDRIIQESNLPERLHDLVMVLNQMIIYMKKNNINNMIVAGDIFHNKSIIHSLAISTFVDFVRHNKDITFYLLDGNHDLDSISGKGVSSLKALENEVNINVIHKPTIIENILMVPWNSELVPNIKKHKAKYLISHFGLNEGELNSGISIKSEISLKNLAKFEYVLLGHYHKPQEIKNEKTQLYYVGSPIQLDRGEQGEEKRFLDVNFDTDCIVSIPTENYKKYFKFKISTNNREEIKNIIKEANQLTDEGNDISIELCADIDTNLLNDCDFRVIDKRDVDIMERGINLDMSEYDRLKKYCEIKDIRSEVLGEYMSIGIGIINETI